MATILQLAELAEVSAESVLRVMHGEPVSEEVARKVREAIDVLGPPPYPRPAAETLPARASKEVATRQEELFDRFSAAAAELETSLPQGISSVVYEALRVEVRPVARHVAEIGALFEHMLTRLERVGTDVASERRERMEDVALLADLITSGWRGVDRRLARLEHMIARLEERQSGRPAGRVIRLEDRQGRTSAE
jgi:hypothetical protein